MFELLHLHKIPYNYNSNLIIFIVLLVHKLTSQVIVNNGNPYIFVGMVSSAKRRILEHCKVFSISIGIGVAKGIAISFTAISCNVTHVLFVLLKSMRWNVMHWSLSLECLEIFKHRFSCCPY